MDEENFVIVIEIGKENKFSGTILTIEIVIEIIMLEIGCTIGAGYHEKVRYSLILSWTVCGVISGIWGRLIRV